MKIRLGVKRTILYLIIVAMLCFNFLTLKASALTLFEFDLGEYGVYILIALVVLIFIAVGIIIYGKYFKKKTKSR